MLGTSSRYGSFKYQDHTGAVFLCGGVGPPLASDFGFVNFSNAHSIKNAPGKFGDFRIQTNSVGFNIQHKDSDGILKLTASAIGLWGVWVYVYVCVCVRSVWCKLAFVHEFVYERSTFSCQ